MERETKTIKAYEWLARELIKMINYTQLTASGQGYFKKRMAVKDKNTAN